MSDKRWIQDAVRKEGSFTKQAKRDKEGVQTFARHVLANPEDYSSRTRRRAALARTLRHLGESEED
jgi:hypothetical protein